MDCEKTVRSILCEVLDNSACADVDVQEDLQPHGMDSLNCMAVLIALEEAFDFETPPEQIGLRFVRNVESICKLVEGEMK